MKKETREAAIGLVLGLACCGIGWVSCKIGERSEKKESERSIRANAYDEFADLITKDLQTGKLKMQAKFNGESEYTDVTNFDQVRHCPTW